MLNRHCWMSQRLAAREGRRGRAVSAALTVALATGVLAGCGGSSSSANQGSKSSTPASSNKLINVTMNSEPVAVTDVWPQIFAYYDGLFQKYGLHVSEQTLSGAGAASAEAVQSGHLDFGIGAAEFTGVDAAGGNLEAVMTDVDHYAFDLVGKPPLSSLQQLKGKTLAVAGKTGSFAVAAALLFKQDGIPLSSVNETDVSSIANVLPAVQHGAADAGLVIYGAASIKAKQAGLSTIASTATAITKPVPAAGVVVSKHFAQSNPKAVQGFINASEDALKQMMGSEALTVQVMSKASGGSLPASAIKAAWSYYKTHVWTLHSAPTADEYQTVLPVLGGFNPAVAKLKPSQLIDPSFANKAESSVTS